MQADVHGHGHDLDQIAHEVINTVTAISGRAQLTRRRIEKTDHLSREHIASDLRTIEEQAARIGALVEACRSLANGMAEEGVGETLHHPASPARRGAE